MTGAEESLQDAPHVVIVGGGFAGVNAALELAGKPIRVTLVDRRVYNTFQPLLYQVATGGLNPGDVTHFLRALRVEHPNIDVVHEHLVGVDTANKRITLLNDETIDYDFLILANGVTTSYFGTPGAKEYAFAMYSRSQAIRIRDTLFTRLEKAASTPETTDGLSVVIVGGGPTGVEIAGALAELRDQGLRPAYPEIDGDAFHITIVQRGTELLKPFTPRLRTYTAKELSRRGVRLVLGQGVSKVLPDAVELSDGTRVPSDLTVWATGVAPHEEVAAWGLPLDKGNRILTDTDLQVQGHPGVFAVGDVAAAPQHLPQLAQPAIQGGKHAARQIQRLIAGQQTRPFAYYDKGQLAVIGRLSAVGEVPGIANLPVLHAIKPLQKVPFLNKLIELTRLPAWFVWLFVHIGSLLGARNRFSTMAGLFVRYGWYFWRKVVPIVGDVPAIRPPKPAPGLTPEQAAEATALAKEERADDIRTVTRSAVDREPVTESDVEKAIDSES